MGGGLAAVCEFFEKFVTQDFGWRGGLDDLKEEFAGSFGFFDTGG
jgi:hypothetical protein